MSSALVERLALDLRSAYEGVRYCAAVELGTLGPAAAPAVPALVEALGDANPHLRLAAAAALGAIGPVAVRALARVLVSDPDELMRTYAAFALGQISPAAAPALPALVDALLTDAQESVRFEAAHAVRRIASRLVSDGTPGGGTPDT